MTTSNHQHSEYSHVHGQFRCLCGAVRLAVGVWADPEESKRLRRGAERATAALFRKHGTAVDAYGQRLA